MKKLLLTILFPVLVMGQTTPTQRQNYVLTTVFRDTLATNPKQGITYFDGLGRPVQKIAFRQSGAAKDLVTHIEYDALGRQALEYLPGVEPSNNLQYVEDSALLNAIFTQYNGLYGDDYPYSQKIFREPFLNRVLEQSAPGNDWRVSSGNGHTVKFDYGSNALNEVKLYKAVAGSTNTVTLVNGDGTTFYTANELYKTITRNENWKTADGDLTNLTMEFKDKEGRLVMKRVYETSVVNGVETPGWHETYYVYDQYGNLAYVLPPLADGDVTQTVLDDLCYQYKYDSRNRMIEKKLPGKQTEYIAYNSQDKPVATGPALNPFGGTDEGWLITKYDIYGRVAYTGWLSQTVSGSERENIESNLATADWFEHYESHTIMIDGVSVNYSNDTEPTTLKLLTVNYYDQYQFSGGPGTLPTSIEGQPVLANVKGLATGSWVRVLTGASQTAADISYTLYDTKSRPIVAYTDNYLGGFTRTNTKLDFMGKAKNTTTTHQGIHGGDVITVKDDFEYTPEDRLKRHWHTINSLPRELLVENNYDDLGQLVEKNVGNDTIAPFQKVNFKYNIRGWLTDINDVGNLQAGSDPKDLFAFKINYNNTIANDVAGTIKPLYNGNIAETTWRTSSDDVTRRYGYQYDTMSRLRNAVYQKPGMAVTNMYNEQISYDKNGNIFDLGRTGDYDSDSYLPVAIDKLTYKYDDDKKNQLLKVTDDTNNPKGFKDDSNGSNDIADDYAYDSYGNMVSDQNKNISSIVYNHLNLPTQINFGTGNKIEYLYDALGQKKKKTVTESPTVITTDYLDGFQYTDDILSFFPQAEGYVNVTYCESCSAEERYNFNYVYQYKDHLGNIRLSYGKDPRQTEPIVLKIIEESHYYPFGLKHTHYNSGKNEYMLDLENPNLTLLEPPPPGSPELYKYKYNGKEYQDELGLNMYDYGARNYDPALGRWMNIDPLAETSRRFSPYTYALNNPVYFIDPDGMQADWHRDPNNENIWVKDKGDNAATLKETVNNNYKDAKLTDSAAKTLYSSMEDGKVDTDKLNPETLHKNLFGLNYPGSKNPKKYNGESDYSIEPTEIEVPAFIHDKEYDELNAVGGDALFFKAATIAADNKFVKSMDKLADKYWKSGEYGLMAKASILGNGLGAAASFKKTLQELKAAVTVPSTLTTPIFLK